MDRTEPCILCSLWHLGGHCWRSVGFGWWIHTGSTPPWDWCHPPGMWLWWVSLIAMACPTFVPELRLPVIRIRIYYFLCHSPLKHLRYYKGMNNCWLSQVASATATFVMMFSSSLSVVEFYLLKRFPIPYGSSLIHLQGFDFQNFS